MAITRAATIVSTTSSAVAGVAGLKVWKQDFSQAKRTRLRLGASQGVCSCVICPATLVLVNEELKAVLFLKE